MLLFACVLTILAIFFINFYAFLRILPLPAETGLKNIFKCFTSLMFRL